MHKTWLIAGQLCGLGMGSAGATEIINQDRSAYKLTVQGEGKLSISTHAVGAGESLYGILWLYLLYV